MAHAEAAEQAARHGSTSLCCAGGVLFRSTMVSLGLPRQCSAYFPFSVRRSTSLSRVTCGGWGTVSYVKHNQPTNQPTNQPCVPVLPTAIGGENQAVGGAHSLGFCEASQLPRQCIMCMAHRILITSPVTLVPPSCHPRMASSDASAEPGSAASSGFDAGTYRIDNHAVCAIPHTHACAQSLMPCASRCRRGARLSSCAWGERVR
jgi:hypothetical protein